MPARCGRCRKRASPSDDILVVTVPGALEMPLALQRLAQIGRLRRAGRAGRGHPRRDLPFRDRRQRVRGRASPSVQLEFGIPIGNGILTTDTDEQAMARADAKGFEAAQAALEIANLLDAIDDERLGAQGRCNESRARQPPRRANSCCRASISASFPAIRAVDAIRAQIAEAAGFAKADRALFRRVVDWRRARVRRARPALFAPHLDRRAADSRRSSARSSCIGAWELKHRPEIPYRVVDQ